DNTGVHWQLDDLVPEERLIQGDDSTVFDQDDSPSSYLAVFRVVVPDHLEISLIGSLCIWVVHFPRLHQRTEVLLSILQADREVRLPLRPPEKGEVVPVALHPVILRHRPEINPLPLKLKHLIRGLLLHAGIVEEE